MIFKIHSFAGTFPLKFGMSPVEITAILGPPQHAHPNHFGTLCYDYHQPSFNVNVGFGGERETANHFGFGRGARVLFRDIDFFADRSNWRRLLDQSSDCHECLGFLVFCDLGIALTGFHDNCEDRLSQGPMVKVSSEVRAFHAFYGCGPAALTSPPSRTLGSGTRRHALSFLFLRK